MVHIPQGKPWAGASPKAPSSEGAFRCQDLPQDPDGLVDLACRVEGGGGEAEGAGGEGTGRFVGQGGAVEAGGLADQLFDA